MARAKSTDPIPAFPPDVDRTAFGHWLSGFADGEACFQIFSRTNRNRPLPNSYHQAEFRIALRADDVSVLSLIQSFWGCGHLVFNSNARSKVANAKPVWMYYITRTSDLASAVVPHFDAFPLRSKKAADYLVWKEAVALLLSVKSRPIVGRAILGGIMPRWTGDETARIFALRDSLRNGRSYCVTRLP